MESSKVYKGLSISMIVINSIILALDHHQIDPWTALVIDKCNLFFFSFFAFELLFKLLSQGFKYYLRDKFNWFDSSVVIISAVDIAVTFNS